jgi:hypothetical protein
MDPRDLVRITDAEVEALVHTRLAAYPGDHRLYQNHIPRKPLTFDAYRDAVVAEMERRRERKLEELRDPPSPRLLRIVSWQYGFTAALDGKGVERGLADGIFLELQRFDAGYLSSDVWRRQMIHTADSWLGLAADHEGRARLIEANAALAAATWLDPDLTHRADEIRAARPHDRLPDRLVEQPRPGFRATGWGHRHWLAWDMKNYGRLDVPSLIAYACDENFSVRARIYRSLGQQPHAAAVPVLREGTLDPHPFARAQACRALGWISDPTVVGRLREVATRDRSPDVRRAAVQAFQRIVGYWTFYGEWPALVKDREGLSDRLAELPAKGLGHFAYELQPTAWQRPELQRALKRYALAPPRDDPARAYHHHFTEAGALEARYLAADPRTEPDEMIALYAISKQRALSDRVVDRLAEPGPVGWNARRAIRALALPA